MKLYATIRSERASKGQGGNDFLEITIKDEKAKPRAVLDITNDEEGLVIDYTDCETEETARLTE